MGSARSVISGKFCVIWDQLQQDTWIWFIKMHFYLFNIPHSVDLFMYRSVLLLRMASIAR